MAELSGDKAERAASDSRIGTCESEYLKEKFEDNVAVAEHYGFAAETALSRAYRSLLLMVHTGSTDGTCIVRYTTVCQETAILHGLAYLLENRVVSPYRDYLSSLVSFFDTLFVVAAYP